MGEGVLDHGRESIAQAPPRAQRLAQRPALILLAGVLAAVPRASAEFSILQSTRVFSPSPVAGVGSSGLFPVREEAEGEVALLTNGEASLAARLQSLRAAKSSVRIQALIFTGDESGLRIAEILKAKKKDIPGIDIRIIVDAASNLVDQTSNPLRWMQTQWMYYDLKQRGIEVEGYEAMYLQWVNEVSLKDPALVNKRFHDKMWVIDGETTEGTAVVGGLNIANEYFRVGSDPAKVWRDQDAMVRGRLVADVAETFDRNFRYFKQIKASRPDLFNTDKAWEQWRAAVRLLGKFKLPLIFDSDGLPKIIYHQDRAVAARVQAVEAAGFAPRFSAARARFFQSRPRLGETYIHQAYLDLIRSAREEILIANAYFIPKGELLRALQEAVRRGVRVKILTNSLKTNDLPQLAMVSRYFYQDLLQAGPGLMEVHEWTGRASGQTQTEGTMHAKFAVFDRKAAVVGSYNLDPRSESLNSETALVFESAPLASELARQFLDKDLGMARRISEQEAALFHDPSGPKAFELNFAMALDEWLGF